MAKYKIIPSSRTIVQSPISIGHKAEKGVQAIEFDLAAWTYGSGAATIVMKRWGDAIPYPVALEIGEDNKATWTLSDIDTAKAGMAYAQLSYIVGDEVVKKSDIYTFRVMDSLTGEGEPPEAYESWLEHLTHLAAQAMAEVLDIEGIATDKTLTVDGGIADAKATGDALALKADKSTTYTKTEVDTLIESVDVETDTTLSVSGKPADAAETGRQLGLINESLQAEVENNNTWTVGSLNYPNGNNYTSTTRIRMDSYVSDDDGVIAFKALTGYEFAVFAWKKSDDSYVGAWNTDSFSKSGMTWTTEFDIRSYTTYKFRLVLRNSVDTSATMTTAESAKCVYVIKNIDRALAEVNGLSNRVDSIITPNLAKGTTWAEGKAIYWSTGEQYNSTTLAASGYIDITGCESIMYMRLCINSSSQPNSGMAFYNSAKEYISGISQAYKSGGGDPSLYEAEVPENAVYVRFTYSKPSAVVNYPFCLYDAEAYAGSIISRANTAIEEIGGINADTEILQKTLKFEPNLWRLTDIKEGYALKSSSGALDANENYNTTGYVPVTGLSKLYLNNGGRYWFYDSSKADLSTGNLSNVNPMYGSVKSITVPADAAYFRICCLKTAWDAAYIYGNPILDCIFSRLPAGAGSTKVLYTIGDSITKGMYAESGASSSTGPTTYCYAYWLAAMNGYELHNLGVSDTGYVATDGNSENNGPDIADNNDFDDADYITIAYGINDYKRTTEIEIGSLAESTLNDGTIVGNMRYTIETIITKAPQAKLFIISPMNGNRIMSGVSSQTCTLENNWYMGSEVNGRTLADIKTAIKAVAEYYGIELIDLQQVGPVNRKNIRTLLGDGLHPSLAGHEMIGRSLAAFVK